jgi:hypothetical protein
MHGHPSIKPVVLSVSLYECATASLPKRTQTARFGERGLERIFGSKRRSKAGT